HGPFGLPATSPMRWGTPAAVPGSIRSGEESMQKRAAESSPAASSSFILLEMAHSDKKRETELSPPPSWYLCSPTQPAKAGFAATARHFNGGNPMAGFYRS